MIEGLDDIRHAAEALANRDDRLKTRLEKAGRDFWSAVYHVGAWPPEIRRKAEDLQRTFLIEGTIPDSVARMSAAEARDAASRIVELLVCLEAVATTPGGEATDDVSPAG